MTVHPSRVLAILCASLLALAACNDSGGEAGTAQSIAAGEYARVAAAPPPPAPPPPAPMMEQGFAGGADMAQSAPAGDSTAQQPPEGMLLAYSWAVGFELPVRNVPGLKDRHEAECRAAGPSLCLVLGGSVSGDGEQYAYGNLSIRAEPRWLEEFRGGLAADAQAANGRVSSESVSTEDLTRNIVDTEARLEAQETLRTRLLALLERPTDEVDDLLAVERELARVQGDIDSARSQLAVMRARVDMSRLDLSYNSIPPAVSTGAFAPVADALRSFLSVFASSLGGVITIIAAAIPIVVILIPLIILVWKLFRGWRRKRKTKAAAESV